MQQQPRTELVVISTLALLMATCSLSCSNWDAAIGNPQIDCATYNSSSESSYSGASYGTYSTSTSSCAFFNAGSTCDDCQGANCCLFIRNCYADSSCIQADQELDRCVAIAQDSDAGQSGQSVAQCAANFVYSGDKASDVVACAAICCPSRCPELLLSY